MNVNVGRVLRALLTLAIIGLLVLFATKVDWHAIMDDLRRAAPVPLALAFLANLISFALKGIRWWIFLRPIGVPSLSLAMRGEFVGAALNNALVANAGEGARVVLVARAARVRSAAVLATVALERFFDVMGYVVMMVVALMVFPLPSSLAVWRPYAIAALVAMIVIIALLARPHAHADPAAVAAMVSQRGPRWFVALKRYLTEFGASVRELSTPGRFFSALALSLLAWVFIIATYAWTAESLGAPLSLAGNVAVTLAVSVGFLVRFTPGNVGVFQVAYAVTAINFGMTRDTAVAVALLIQAVQILPVTLIGFALSPKFVMGGSPKEKSSTGRDA